MWDIESKYLQKDETLEYEDRPSMLSFIFSFILVGFMAYILIIQLILTGFTNVFGGDRIALAICLLLALLSSIYVILKRLSTRYAISNRGLLKRTGIITNSIKTVPFKHITSIEVKETILGKIFHYADLIIETSGSGQPIEFNWKYVVMAHKVKKLIEKHVGGES